MDKNYDTIQCRSFHLAYDRMCTIRKCCCNWMSDLIYIKWKSQNLQSHAEMHAHQLNTGTSFIYFTVCRESRLHLIMAAMLCFSQTHFKLNFIKVDANHSSTLTMIAIVYSCHYNFIKMYHFSTNDWIHMWEYLEIPVIFKRSLPKIQS